MTNQPANSQVRHVKMDDLKRIKGIGEHIEERLHQVGILAYEDLAALSPDEVARSLSNVIGMTPDRVINQDWIGQARKLATEREKDNQEVDVEEGSQRYATFSVRLLVQNRSQIRRTNVIHVQDGEQETWAGWDSDRLLGFIHQQVDLQPAIPHPEKNMGSEERTALSQDKMQADPQVTTTYPTLEILDATSVFEAGGSEPSSIISTDQDWSIHVEWLLSGIDFTSLTGNWLIIAYLESMGPGTEYTLPYNSQEDSYGKKVSVADCVPLPNDQARYQTDIPVNQGDVVAGIYTMVVTITYRPANGSRIPVAGFHELGMFQFYDPA